METPLEACSLSIATVFALKSRHYLDDEKATLVFAADGIRIVAYIKARGVEECLAGQYVSFLVYD
jgi:hypothetical protein